MWRRIMAGASAILAVGLLPACQTSDDPRDGGFVSGAQGLLTGTYEERQEEREKALAAEQLRQKQLLERAEKIRQERAEVAARLTAAEDRLAELERKIGALKAQIISEGSARAGELARLQEVEDEFVVLHAAIDRAQESDRPVDAAREDVEKIRSVLSNVADLVEEVSAGTGS